MGLIWNNEYVLEKNKELHKTGCSSTEATEMADNCFQVWHCSLNEFVLLCGRLAVSSPFFHFSLILHTHKHTRDRFFFFFDFASLCFHAIWPLYLPSPWLSLFFLSLNLFLPRPILCRSCFFFFFTSLLYLFLFLFVKICTQGAPNTAALRFLRCIIHSE